MTPPADVAALRLGGARARIDASRAVTLRAAEVLRGSDDAGLFAALEPTLFLVDGNNLLWRAAYGRPAPFTAADGRDITPLFRFFTKLRRALGTYGVFSECVVCFDGPAAWTRRLRMDPSYKANRNYDDRDVSFMCWLPEIRGALEACGVRTLELEAEESDDVIATLAASAGPRPVRILSTDRDYFQLVSDTVHIVSSKSRPALIGPVDVYQRFGVRPHQWCDFRALSGDPSDGIPGVRGLGPKRAAGLLGDGCIEGLRDRDPSDADAALVLSQLDDVLRWRDMIRLHTDLDAGYVPTGAATPKLPSPIAVCRELGLVG